MIRTGSIGNYDDDQFLDTELLYRRIPAKPPYLKTRDPITGLFRPGPAAFSIKGEPDGLSIYIDSLIRRFRLKTRNLCSNWQTHGVARFEAGCVRPGLGVIADEVDEPSIGKAHGLIRGPDGIPSRGQWNAIRDNILAHSVYFDSEHEPGVGGLDRARLAGEAFRVLERPCSLPAVRSDTNVEVGTRVARAVGTMCRRTRLVPSTHGRLHRVESMTEQRGPLAQLVWRI